MSLTTRTTARLGAIAVLVLGSLVAVSAARSVSDAAVAPPQLGFVPRYAANLQSTVNVSVSGSIQAISPPTVAFADPSTGEPNQATSVTMQLHTTCGAACTSVWVGTLSVTAPGAQCGVDTVIVSAVDGNKRPYQLTGSYTVLCPTITLDPPIVVGGGITRTIDLTAVDFDPRGDDIGKTLVFDGTAIGNEPYRKPITFSEAAACGQHTVTLVQPANNGAQPEQLLEAAAPFVVACPQLTIVPTSVIQPGNVTLQADGFAPSTATTFSISGAAVLTGTSDSTGSLNSPLSTAALKCGKVSVVASQSVSIAGVPSTLTATATFTLVCTKAKLQIVPPVLLPGTAGEVIGSGFGKSAPLTMTWTLPDGSHEAVNDAPAKASATGTVDFYTLIFGLDQLGQRTLTVTDGQHPAVAIVLVAPNPMQPSGGPEFTVRH